MNRVLVVFRAAAALAIITALFAAISSTTPAMAGSARGENRMPVRAVVNLEDDDDFDDEDDDDDDFDDDDVVQPPLVDDDDDFDDDDDDFDDDQPGRVVIDDDNDPTTDGYFGGEVIVRLAAGASIDELNARHGATTVAAIRAQDIYLLQLPFFIDQATVDRDFGEDDRVVWAELNYVSQAPEGRPGYFFTSAVTGQEPGDSYAPDLLGVEDALACGVGGGVIVAILDTGVDGSHPALQGRVLTTGVNMLTTGDGTTADWGNGIDDDGDGFIDEMTGHGTHVAGIIAQVAPTATILPITVLNSDGVGDAFFLAAGIYEAIERGARVINLSLGSTRDAEVVSEAVAVAAETGVMVIAAAGNTDRERPPEFPAADPNAVSVAATDEGDRKSEFSNYGEQVAISAPGTDIVSAFPGGLITSWSGTSMATPFVAGAAALILSANPDLSPADVLDELSRTAVDLSASNPSFVGKLGAGRLDVAAAVGCE